MELLVAPQNSITSQLLLLVSFSPPRSESASQAMAWHGPSRIASLLPSEQALRQVKSRQVSELSSSQALKRCRPLSYASYYFQLPAPWPLAHSFTLLSPLTKAPRMKTSERQRVIVAGMHFVSGFPYARSISIVALISSGQTIACAPYLRSAAWVAVAERLKETQDITLSKAWGEGWINCCAALHRISSTLQLHCNSGR